MATVFPFSARNTKRNSFRSALIFLSARSMEFPAYLRIGPFSLHPHWVFLRRSPTSWPSEFTSGLKKRDGDVVTDENRWWVIAAMAGGAAIGSKILFWFEDPRLTAAHWNDPLYI